MRILAILAVVAMLVLPILPQSANAGEMTEKQLHKEVSQLLKELDGFRNSPVFAKCMFGCGPENPGRAWNEKRKALDEKITPQTPGSLMLKAAPGNLFFLAKAYAKKDKNDIKHFRSEVMEGLGKQKK